MVRKLVVSIGLALLAIVPLRADTKYTMHMETRMAAGGGNDPMSQMAGGMLTQMFPAGGIDQVVVTGDKGTRTEMKQAFANFKAGTVTLMRPDGSMVMLDPTSKTYWKQAAMSAEATAAMAGMAPQVKVAKRGVFETVNGMKAEHLTLTMTMAIPGVDASQLPPGMAPDFTMSYDVWLTDAVKGSAGASALSATMLKQFGMSNVKELSDGRMMLKGVMSMFGVEIVMTTSAVTNEPAAASLFEIPADYKEVPSPIR
jgi:hypothetical protein